ncbi:hypothetical protein O1L60_32660 [Streptomyces diastatochromogenes]|nr:hypothetical protein [Streptomyces diastatochromogenes]
MENHHAPHQARAPRPDGPARHDAARRGVLLGQTAAAEPAAAKPITCNVTKLRADARKERDRGNQLKRLGATTEARKAFARADALERRARQCADADSNSRPPLWK